MISILIDTQVYSWVKRGLAVSKTSSKKMSQVESKAWRKYLVILISLLTIGIHFYLSRHYYELQLGLSSGDALCNINKTLNCDVVTASRFSSLWGVPLALWGFSTQLILFFFLSLFFLGLAADKARLGRFTFYMSIFIAGTSLVMGSISVMYLKSYCIFCLLAYVLSFVHLWTIKGLQLADHTSPHSSFFLLDIKAALGSSRWIAISAFSILPLTFLFNAMLLDSFGGAALGQVIQTATSQWQTTEAVQFSDKGLSKGPKDAKMTIVEFADFLCPHCKHAVPSLKVFTESHPEVRLIFKSFPLDGLCNANKEMPKGDGTRCLISKTVHCAEKLNQKGWVFYEEVFKNQEQLMGTEAAKAFLLQLTQSQGLDASAMNACVSSEETHQAIMSQSQEGLTGAIEGTPSIFVNGRFLSRGQILGVLQKVLDLLRTNP